MDLTSFITLLINQCNSLKPSQKTTLHLNTTYINKKVKTILKLDGCNIEVKSENTIILTKNVKNFSIFNPNTEIENIINSKGKLLIKLQKIEKIVKNYELDESTAKKLKKYLDSLLEIVNKKIKSEIEKIKKEIKIKNFYFA
ncbi:MAG: hypothetical protein ABGX26_07640 [Nautiliaceae bacterium]